MLLYMETSSDINKCFANRVGYFVFLFFTYLHIYIALPALS